MVKNSGNTGLKIKQSEIKSLFIFNGEQITREQEIPEHFNSFVISIEQDTANNIYTNNMYDFKELLRYQMPSSFSFNEINKSEVMKYGNQLQ